MELHARYIKKNESLREPSCPMSGVEGETEEGFHLRSEEGSEGKETSKSFQKGIAKRKADGGMFKY